MVLLVENFDLIYSQVMMPEGPKLLYYANALVKFGFVAQNKMLDDTLFRYYEEVGSRVKYLKIKPGDIFLDIGACVGSWSIPAALLGAQVFAFEIGGPQLSGLLSNMKLNNIPKDQIKIDCVALCADDNSKLVFDGKMRVRKKDMPTYVKSGSRTIPIESISPDAMPVESTSLDTWVNERRDELPHIDYIKIDVEGAEFEVLRGAYHILREFKPKLLIEIHESTSNTLRPDIEYLLKDLDYKHEHEFPFHDYFY